MELKEHKMDICAICETKEVYETPKQNEILQLEN